MVNFHCLSCFLRSPKIAQKVFFLALIICLCSDLFCLSNIYTATSSTFKGINPTSSLDSTSIAELNRGGSSSYNQQPFFLRSTYKLKGDEAQTFFVRQVPGDGSCLFHSIAAWLSYIKFDKHLDFDHKMRSLSSRLRRLAVDTLIQNRTLMLENGEEISSFGLLDLVAEHYNITAHEYCQQMLDTKTWGGGPEIVALSNHFQCPIHVYQLCTVGLFPMRSFRLELCATFGSPCFDSKAPIQLLCADGR